MFCFLLFAFLLFAFFRLRYRLFLHLHYHHSSFKGPIVLFAFVISRFLRFILFPFPYLTFFFFFLSYLCFHFWFSLLSCLLSQFYNHKHTFSLIYIHPSLFHRKNGKR